MAKKNAPAPVTPTKHVAPTDAPVLSMAKRLTVLSEARTSLSDAQEALIQRFGRVTPDVAVPQDALQAFMLLKSIADDATKAADKIKEAFVAHKAAKGEFEHGRFALSIKVVPKTTVAWKDVSTDMAREAAQARGEPFIDTVFEELIKVKYGKPSSQTTVSVIESA